MRIRILQNTNVSVVRIHTPFRLLTYWQRFIIILAHQNYSTSGIVAEFIDISYYLWRWWGFFAKMRASNITIQQYLVTTSYTKDENGRPCERAIRVSLVQKI